jgi:2'-5' RNA ligase
MRLFFAFELPAEVAGVLGRLPRAEEPDYRWVEPGMLHLTLAFLGEQPAQRLDVLREVGGAAATAARAAVLRLGQAGGFGPRAAPRVLWVSLEGDVSALEALQADLTARLRGAGIMLEDRPFRPHITLARRRESAKHGAPVGWPPTLGPTRPAFSLHTLRLFESRLSPRGATYVVLAEFPLGHSTPG